MAYLTGPALRAMGFAHLGDNVKISDKAAIYDPERISLGDHCRIDDFCVVSGSLTVGRNVYFGPFCLVAGGAPGILFGNFATLAYGVRIFSQSDDYSGETMTNSTVPRTYKCEKFASVTVGRHVIIGAGATVLPGVDIADGCAIGAMALIRKSTQPWSIYAGVPAVRLKERSRRLLDLERRYLSSESSPE